MKKIYYLPTVLVVGIFLSTPLFASAANTGGCSSAGPSCTVNTANDGVCTQNTETGDFYCRPTAIPNTANNNSQTTSGFVPLAPITGLTDPKTLGSVVNSATLANFFNNLYKFLIGLAAALAVIEIIWGGLEISTKDSVSKQSDGRERITQAILGLVLVLCPVLVFSIINPAILNLSLNLPPLDTKSGAPLGTGGGTGSRTVDPQMGCSVTGTNKILLVASCNSSKGAQDWVSSCSESTNIGGTLFFSSTPKVTANPTNGIKTYVVVCSTTKKFVFIDTKSTYFSVINQFRPLVRTDSNQNNGSEAMNFAAICKSSNLDLQTCVSDTASLSGNVPCNLTGANSGTSWKCYEQTLTCRDANTTNPKCTSSVDWVPFQ